MAKKNTQKRDLEQEITDKIVEAMEAGEAPWTKPWKSGSKQSAGLPLRHNDEPYQGINTLVLWLAAEERGYQSSHWMTYNQSRELGGQVRKGEKSETAIYAGVVERDDDENDEKKRIPFKKGYAVFNADQIEGLPEKYYTTPEPVAAPQNTEQRRPELDQFFAAPGVPIKEHKDFEAAYYPSADEIRMPAFENFRSSNAYYETLAHEVVHSTGHEKRLGRDLKNGFGSKGYAKEELVAELGSAFMMARLGVQPNFEHHAAYLNGWIKALKNDKRLIFTAASGASKAAAFVNDEATKKGAKMAWATSSKDEAQDGPQKPAKGSEKVKTSKATQEAFAAALAAQSKPKKPVPQSSAGISR